jgi:hypothetical protein
VFTAEEVDHVGVKESGNTTDDTFLKASLNMSLKPAVSLMKLFSGKKQNFWSWGLLSSARLLGLINYRTPVNFTVSPCILIPTHALSHTNKY